MEVTLPLVIFAVLIILRSRMQAVPKPTMFHPTRALPSAGLLPMVQSFCDGGVTDGDGFVSQPNSFIDTLMTIMDGLTQIVDGEWPPIPAGNQPEGQNSAPADNTNTFSQYARQRPQDFWKEPDSVMSTFSMFTTEDSKRLLELGEQILMRNQYESYKILDKLQSMQATYMGPQPYAQNVDSTNTTSGSNTTLPEQCARYGLDVNGTDAQDMHDWYEHLLKLWEGTEIFLCMNPRDSTDQDASATPPQFSQDSFQFGGSSAGNLANLPIEEMVLQALSHNPRITYAPSGTDADRIIEKMVEFFGIFNDITQLAEDWLATSSTVRDLIEAGDSIVNPVPPADDSQPEFPSLDPEAVTTIFLALVDTLDYLSCYWMSLIQGEIDFSGAFVGFPSEEELVTYSHVGSKEDEVTVLAGLVFEMGPNGSLPEHLTYKIRQNATISQTTKMVKDLIWEPGMDWRGEFYLYNGFIVLQDLIERSVITLHTETPITEPGIYVQMFPTPCYIEDGIRMVLVEHMFPLAIVMGWVFAVAMLIRNIVYEKEQRLKEVMRLMGLRDSVHWLAWFTTAFIQMTITVTLLTLLLKLGLIFVYSDGFLLWCIFMIYGLNAILFAFIMSVLFDKAKIAAAAGGILYLLTYVPYMIITILENGGFPQNVWLKAICSFFSTTGMGLSASYFNFYETVGVGINFDNFMESQIQTDYFNPFLACMMSVISSVVYLILVWYIDNVHPGDYGLPKPWYFPFTATYWCGRPSFEENKGCASRLPSWMKTALIKMGCIGVKNVVDDLLRQTSAANVDPTYFEAEPQLKETLKIKELSKVYSNGKLALDGLNLKLYEGQILSFLGHNGAGKTTTMSILTGMIPPSSGTATIYGLDIRTDMYDIRRTLGMCPQHNVLFDSMTVDEHLQFYARLKGTPAGAIDLEVENMLDMTGLRQKRYATVDRLSGGMKRKLSIGIAFISGSRAVILDEPTAGVDPWSRREIWDLILKYKEGRTIMLSTHHMDEADILGDRIAVISHGALNCTGSSLFLKGTFGEGYHLIVAKKLAAVPLTSLNAAENIVPEEATLNAASAITRCTERAVSLFITAQIPSVYLKAETPLELHYIIPFEKVKDGSASQLFDSLDHNKRKLHITGYGVSDTSLEEVFLKVTSQAKTEASGVVNQAFVENGDIPEERKKRKKSDSSPKNRRRAQSDMRGDPNCIEDSYGRVYTPDPIARTRLRNSDNNVGKRIKPLHDNKCIRRSASWDADVKVKLAENDEMIEVCKDSHHHDQHIALSNMLTGFPLWCQQLQVCLYKRFIFTARNWKSLISQVLLPVTFVIVAMLIGMIGGPSVGDEPALELSPAQYLNATKGLNDHYIPFSDHKGYDWSYDAVPSELMMTYKLPSGICSTCVLTDSAWDANVTEFNADCDNVLDFIDENVVDTIMQNYEPNTTLNGTTLPESDGKVRFYPLCQCAVDNRGLICEEDDNYLHPPEFRVITNDVMQNITSQNETAYFYYTSQEYRMSRYGATTFGHARSHVPYWLATLPDQLKHVYVARVAKAWYESRGFHAMPTYVNAINNAILRANLPEKKGNPAAYGITVVNHPMEGTTGFGGVGSLIFGAELIVAILVVCGFSFIPAGFIIFLVQERASKAKHLQCVSGLNPLVYWISNLIWDMVIFIFPVIACAIVLAAFQIPSFTEGENYYATCLLLLIFGWSCTPMMYPASFVFKEASSAYVLLACFNVLVGVALLFVTFMLDYMANTEDLAYVSEQLKRVFLIIPSYCLGRGLMDIVLTKTLNEVNALIGAEGTISPFDWDVTGRNLTAMVCVGVFFYVITILIEYKFFVKPSVMSAKDMPEVGQEDRDVAEERRRVQKGHAQEDIVRLENLTKIYKSVKLGKLLAVQRLSLGIPRGECFGMLGVNGAGKTSTFKMLTGDHPASGGDARITGHSILKDMNTVRKNIGYCPQFDALFDELTARQHLTLYSKMRGIQSKEVKQVVDWALRKLELTDYADKPSGTYSGGNRRKLSTAIALIGDPPVIFLDEPTAGMDPYAKRFLWDLVLNLVQEGKCIILTSHSMEECETLCTRLAIMVGGRFHCMGSVQHLKGRFGDGYNIKVTVKGPDYNRDILELIKYMNAHLPNATLKERHFKLVEYEVQPGYVQLSEIFKQMEAGKRTLNVEEYSVCQNTLDNVFINFVNEQNKLEEGSALGGKQRPSSPNSPDANKLEDGRTPTTSTITDRDRNESTTSFMEIEMKDVTELENSSIFGDIDFGLLDSQGTTISLKTYL